MSSSFPHASASPFALSSGRLSCVRAIPIPSIQPLATSLGSVAAPSVRQILSAPFSAPTPFQPVFPASTAWAFSEALWAVGRWRARALIGLLEVIADLFHGKCVDEAALKISEASLRAVIFPGNEIVDSVRAAQRIISIRIWIEDAVQKSKLPPA